jgi:serine phosphatase RsbU (regulator of sigma subunit)
MKAGAVEFLTKPFDDTELLEAIWQAIEHDSATHDAQTDHKEELAAAARIQQGLMAVTTFQPPFAEAMGRNQPCKEIGGDFFSVLTVGDSVVAAIADVSGKGVAAAVMASLLQGMIHEGLLSNVPLPEIARNANEFFCVIFATIDIGNDAVERPIFGLHLIAHIRSEHLQSGMCASIVASEID